MAEGNKVRVLFRVSLGLPFRQASNEERKRVMQLWQETATKWKSAGVKLVGYFGADGSALHGFGHHYIFEVDDLSVIREMDADIFYGELGKYVEDFAFNIGWGRGTEDWWESL
jgi:hypothetical protein